MSLKTILVTGGLGFIGSHTCVELLDAGYHVVAVDNLSNSDTEVIDGIKKASSKQIHFINADVSDKNACNKLFDEIDDKVEGIIHFAAFKAVGESVEKPLDYYRNNLFSLVNLLEIARERRIGAFIFSSSCTVYGQADTLPIHENAPVKVAESPYGNTKQIGEEIIADSCKSEGLTAIALRYFNPIGAHPSTQIGELPKGVPQNLVPFITQTAAGLRKELSVFGNDYPTRDGTCIRDYIYVVDLAKAHLVALERLINKQNKDPFEIFNIGTGKGSTVLEVIESFERVSGKKLDYKVVGRRAGDVIAAYADTTKANEELGWKAEYDLDFALKTAWEWEMKIRNS